MLTGSSICSSAPNTGTVSSSTSGGASISYQLYDGSAQTVQSPKAGTGSGLTWTGLAAGTGYYVIATGPTPTSCTSQSNAVDVATVTNPTALVLTGSSICSSAPNTGTVTSGTSGAASISYQLFDGSDQPVQSPKSGTGSALSWTGLSAGTGYYVVATGASPTNCTSTSNAVNVSSVSNPTALALTGSSICSSAPNTGTVTSGTSGAASISYQLYDGFDQPVQSPKAGTGSGLSWSGLAAGTGYYVVATGASPTNCTSTSNAVNVASITNPIGPTVDYTPPACDANTFSITVNGLQENDIITVYDKNGAAIGALSPSSPYNVPSSTSSKIFSGIPGIPAGSGYQVILSRNGCISTTTSCSSSASRVFQQQPQEPDGTIEQVTIVPKEEPVVQGQAINSSEPMVKGIKVTAYPNPYSDKVRFVVNTEQAGEANLELVNILGQKIATIYNGHLMAGSRSFEVTLPMQHRSTVVYILRLNGKQVTGKLLQSGY